jgi:Signal recognition particle 14kD protein
MVQLDTDPFLNELNKLFDRNKETGSVTCTMKRSETMP